MTPAEKAWIDRHGELTYVYDPDWPPFEWRDETGRHTGMIADVYRILAEETGIRFKPVATENWAEAMERFKAHEADLISTITETEDRKRFIRFTRHSLFRVPGVLLQRFDAPPLAHEDLAKALRHRSVGVVRGYAVADYLRRAYPGIDLVEFPTITEGLERLRSGKIDLFATNDATAGYLIHKQGYGDLVKAATLNWYVILKIGLQPDTPQVVADILDRAIAAIPRTRLDAIYRRWTASGMRESAPRQESGLLDALPLDTLMIVLGILTVLGLFGWYHFREKGVRVLGLPLLGATLLFFTAALLVTALALAQAKRDRKSEIAQSLQTVLNVTHSSLVEWFTTKRHQVNHLVNRTDFLKPFFESQSSGKTPADLSDRLFIALKSQLSGTTGYLLIDRNGTILSASEPSLAHRDVTYAPVRRLLDRAYREGYAFFTPMRFPKDRLGHLRHYYIFNAVVDPETGKKVAIFAARLDPTPIFNIVRQGRIGKSGETYLMNARLQMISRSRFERQLKELGLLPVNKTSFLNIRLEHDGKPTRAAAMALRRQNGYDVDGYTGYRGVPVFGAWVWDDMLNLAITVEIDRSEVMASFRDLEQTIYGVVLGIVGLALMLVLFIVWYARTTQKAITTKEEEILRQQEAYETLSATIDQRVAERMNQAKGTK